jgi:hypothetical protein
MIPRKEGDIDGDPSLWFSKLIESEQQREILPRREIDENIAKIRNFLK